MHTTTYTYTTYTIHTTTPIQQLTPSLLNNVLLAYNMPPAKNNMPPAKNNMPPANNEVPTFGPSRLTGSVLWVFESVDLLQETYIECL